MEDLKSNLKDLVIAYNCKVINERIFREKLIKD